MLPIAHQIREQINEHQRLAHQERRGCYQHTSLYGRDIKSKGDSDRNAPGKDLGEITDARSRPILTEAEVEQAQIARDCLNFAGEQSTFF